MTACATVADLLELTDNPARVSVAWVMRALGVGYPRAKVVRDLAIGAVQRKATNVYGFSATEAADWIDRFGSDQPERAA